MNRAFSAINFPNNPLNYPAHPEQVVIDATAARELGLTAVVADVPQGSTRL